MSYENPPQAEGINVSDEHPVRELFVLLAAVAGIVVLLVILLSGIAGWLVQFVPPAAERELADRVGVEQMFTLDGQHDGQQSLLNKTARQQREFVLQLSHALIQRAELPEDMVVQVHYVPGDTVNAFAMLGGHVVLYEGLLAKLPNENALAMVLAHEIAHIKLRHPLVAMSRGLTISVALSSLLGVTDNSFIGGIVEWIGYSSTLSFSRAQERQADAFAADLLIDYYGHLNGAEDLFKAFAGTASDADNGVPVIEFLSTHPGLAERMDTLAERARQLGSAVEPVALPWR